MRSARGRHLRLPRGVAVVCVVTVGFLLTGKTFGLFSSFAGEPTYRIDIYKSEVPRIPLALVGFPSFRLSSGGEDLAETASTILRADLEFSRIFDVVDPALLPFDPRTVLLTEERKVLPALASLKVSHLVIGALASRGNELVLEGRLYEVARGEMIGGKRFVSSPPFLRNMVHRLSDEIVYRLTGEKGIATSRIAFVSVVENAKEIYIMDYDGYNPTLVTGNRSLNLSPRFSPGGKFLAYTSYRDRNPDLFLLNMETGRREKVSASPGLNIAPAWFPDGRGMLLSMSRDGETHLYQISVNGAEVRRLTFGSHINVSPTLSPTGRQVAFTSDRGGTPQIYAMDVEGTNVRRITWEGEYNASPRWSPRGDKIVFVSRVEGQFHIFLTNPDGSDVRQLTTGPGGNEHPTWSGDGRHIVFTSTRGGRRDIYVMDADGSAVRRLTDNGRENYLPDWSPS